MALRKRPSSDAAAVAREARVEKANLRLDRRRSALRLLNAVVGDMGHPSVQVDAKQTSSIAVQKLFRFLARRDFDGDEAKRCREAVKMYVDNGGKLPEGMSLREEGSGVTMLPDESPAVPRHKVLMNGFVLHSRAFMLTYNSSTFSDDTWQEFEAWVQTFARQRGARGWAACLETSLHAGASIEAVVGGNRCHGHAYFIWVDDVGIYLESLEPLRFQGVRPRVDVCKGPGSAATAGMPRRAALHGLWYVTVMKDGTLHSASNFRPWQHYTPCTYWLCSLYDTKKLTHEAFVELSAEFRTGHAKRKRDVDEILKNELELAVDQHVAAELAELEARDPLKTFRDFAEINTFVESFKESRRRRPVLLLVGGTNRGKSLLGAHVLRTISKLLGTPSFVEVTVEDDRALDLSGYDHRTHAGVLLDGVADTLTLWRHRETLQGRPKKVRGGRSATMVYSYPFTLARRAVVATMDLTAKNLHLLQTNDWLKDRRNVLTVRLTAPSWIEAGSATEPVVPSDQVMKAWGVQEVFSFYAARDAAGIAAVLVQNSVNGSDLYSFSSWNQLVTDLRLAPFAARKTLCLRDAFLSA